MPKRPTEPHMVPDIVPVFPLSGALLLPRTHRPLNIFEPRYIALIDHALAHERLIGLIQPEAAREESPRGNVPLCRVGCLGRLTHFEEAEDGRYLVVLEGLVRFETVAEIAVTTPFRQWQISTTRFAADFTPENGEDRVDRQKFIKMMRAYAEFAQIDLDWADIEETETADLVNLACVLSPYGSREKQVLLEAKTLAERAETLMALTELEMTRGRTGARLQ